MSYAPTAFGQRSLLGAIAVVLIHVALILVLKNGLSHTWTTARIGPFEAVLIDEPVVKPAEPPPPPPSYRALPVESVPMPELAIDYPADTDAAISPPAAEAAPAVAALAAAPMIVTAPRIDLEHSIRAPEYPPSSKRLGEEGRVVLLIHVLPDGKPSEVKIETSSGFPTLDEAARRHALEGWRFVPARSGNQAIAAWNRFALSFHLTR